MLTTSIAERLGLATPTHEVFPCPSRKTAWSTEGRALRALADMRDKEQRTPPDPERKWPRRVYRCTLCPHWHMTAREER